MVSEAAIRTDENCAVGDETRGLVRTKTATAMERTAAMEEASVSATAEIREVTEISGARAAAGYESSSELTPSHKHC